ncbi:hypothetical protein HWV62_45410 [Athelia sp. TMB]|nr:hypothetical protein HWV62_45410 [Athelia sp. TMB]
MPRPRLLQAPTHSPPLLVNSNAACSVTWLTIQVQALRRATHDRSSTTAYRRARRQQLWLCPAPYLSGGWVEAPPVGVHDVNQIPLFPERDGCRAPRPGINLARNASIGRTNRARAYTRCRTLAGGWHCRRKALRAAGVGALPRLWRGGAYPSNRASTRFRCAVRGDRARGRRERDVRDQPSACEYGTYAPGGVRLLGAFLLLQSDRVNADLWRRTSCDLAPRVRRERRGYAYEPTGFVVNRGAIELAMRPPTAATWVRSKGRG